MRFPLSLSLSFEREGEGGYPNPIQYETGGFT